MTTSTEEEWRVNRAGAIAHAKRCLMGLPGSQLEVDGSGMALTFYCIGILDLLDGVPGRDAPHLQHAVAPPSPSTSKNAATGPPRPNHTHAIANLNVLQQTQAAERSAAEAEQWRAWIWEQYDPEHGAFRPGPFMTASAPNPNPSQPAPSPLSAPHIIMTYTALLALAILRDPFTQLSRAALLRFVGRCQRRDGSFSTLPAAGDTDLRTLYCAFAISSMLNDWSAVDVPRALAFLSRCRTYQGGYGQQPHAEAHGGLTYVAVASIYLSGGRLGGRERRETVRWLVSNQAGEGGFCGRTNKKADTCYCFWCAAALRILGADTHTSNPPTSSSPSSPSPPTSNPTSNPSPTPPQEDPFDAPSMHAFVGRCEYRYGGIAKSEGDGADPYHTYLALAAVDPARDLDWMLNARRGTVEWVRGRIGREVPPSGGEGREGR